jgi:hypothetical protein
VALDYFTPPRGHRRRSCVYNDYGGGPIGRKIVPWSNEMTFNDGKPYHGSSTVSDGKLVGTTDTDYFYFFCPRCQDRHILRILDYGNHVAEEAGGSRYPDEKPKQKKDFTLVFKLYCPHCELTDFVKISNTGWQGGRLRSPD